MNRIEAYVRRAAEQRPEAVAIVQGSESFTYATLDAAADRMGRMLQEQGVRPGDRVGLLAPKRPVTLAALLGVLRAGGVYVPLDPSSPAVRLQRMLDASGAPLILAGAGLGPALADLLTNNMLAMRPRIGWLGPTPPPTTGSAALPTAAIAFSWDDLAAMPAAVRHPPSQGGVAHLLFTSGSTGIPKGVMVTHESVRAFVDWSVSSIGLRAGDRLSGHPPLHFDLSTWDMFGCYAAGATLCPVPAELNLLPVKLAAFMREMALTQWFSVPSVYGVLAHQDLVQSDDFPSIERFLWCGEVLPTSVLRHWMDRLPRRRWVNLYGPTEATIASSWYEVTTMPPDDRTPIPIGRPCGGESLHVLDEQFDASPAGEIGNLFIGGVGLSPGYWQDEDKTAAAFVTPSTGPAAGRRIYRTGDLARMDSEGVCHFVGRADSQIKSRGYRIELGEIEAALATLAELHESAVVAITSDKFDGATICAALVPAEGRDDCAPVIRARLAALVPSYMLPTRWLELDALPRNANGKVDRPALRARFEAADTKPAS